MAIQVFNVRNLPGGVVETVLNGALLSAFDIDA
jgi:hypothetical protein